MINKMIEKFIPLKYQTWINKNIKHKIKFKDCNLNWIK